MKTFKFKTQILTICFALIASEASALKMRIGTDGRKYLIEYNEKYNWFEASNECARRNRQLLTIDSAEKQEVINKILEEERDEYLWLGANDEFNPGDNVDRPFFWSATGKQFTYANWAVKNPDKFENRHCVLIFAGDQEWINIGCDNKNGFICEEKQSLKSSNNNSTNVSGVVQKFIHDFDLLKDNMAELNGRLESIEQMGKDANYEVEKLTNITENAVQKILDKLEVSTKELNHKITKQGSDLSDQLKRSVDELNVKLSEKQNFTNPPH